MGFLDLIQGLPKAFSTHSENNFMFCSIEFFENLFIQKWTYDKMKKSFKQFLNNVMFWTFFSLFKIDIASKL